MQSHREFRICETYLPKKGSYDDPYCFFDIEDNFFYMRMHIFWIKYQTRTYVLIARFPDIRGPDNWGYDVYVIRFLFLAAEYYRHSVIPRVAELLSNDVEAFKRILDYYDSIDLNRNPDHWNPA